MAAFAILVVGTDGGVCAGRRRPSLGSLPWALWRNSVQLPNFSGFDPADLFEHVAGLVTAAEQAGFDSVWVMDHFFQLPPLGGPDQPMLEAYTLLGALAARTQRVQLGTLVTGVTYRNPGILAKIVTTLDVISRGRAILGISVPPSLKGPSQFEPHRRRHSLPAVRPWKLITATERPEDSIDAATAHGSIQPVFAPYRRLHARLLRASRDLK